MPSSNGFNNIFSYNLHLNRANSICRPWKFHFIDIINLSTKSFNERSVFAEKFSEKHRKLRIFGWNLRKINLLITWDTIIRRLYIYQNIFSDGLEQRFGRACSRINSSKVIKSCKLTNFCFRMMQIECVHLERFAPSPSSGNCQINILLINHYSLKNVLKSTETCKTA